MSDLQKIVSDGNRWESLVALRDLLAEQLVVASPRDVAALSRQLRDVLTELDSRPVEKASPVDELTSRRRTRRGQTTGATGS